jgi:hypothetical protein
MISQFPAQKDKQILQDSLNSLSSRILSTHRGVKKGDVGDLGTWGKDETGPLQNS